MKNQSLTLTVIAKMTSNYGESLGNISSVQKIFKKGKAHTVRTRESLKNAIMVQSGFYNDLQVDVDGAAQKRISKVLNVSNCRALEGGYFNTKNDDDKTYMRNSSFYLTDAISCYEFINETRFHNNLYLAQTRAKQEGLNVQDDAGEVGLMPYQYEYDKGLKQYSMTIDLDMIGRDENFEDQEAPDTEKASRVCDLVSAVENLSLVVRGNLDNAEPLFVVGGITNRKNHAFENLVKTDKDLIKVSEDFVDRLETGFRAGILDAGEFSNHEEVVGKLKCVSVTKFFKLLKEDINTHYGI